jgi:uncharacterized repeat protein (TIGR01451 family)
MALASARDLAADVPDTSWRGQPGSSHQEWRFDTASPTPAAEVCLDGTPHTASVTPGQFALGWQSQLPGLGDASGFWDLGSSGTISSPLPSLVTAPEPSVRYILVSFSGNANPAAPEFVSNSFGALQSAVTVGAAGAGWIDQQPIIFGTNRSGVCDLGRSGNISLSISNAIAPTNSWNFIHVQVTQYRDGLYHQLANLAITGATLVRSQIRTNESFLTHTNSPFRGSWVVEQTVWLLEPCPDSETVIISSGPGNSVAIDQVVVDTRCATRDEGDISPPCWRGRPGSTYQNWSFHRPGNPSVPEDVFSPGSPSASITTGGLALGWQDVLVGFGCRQGYWDLGNGGQMSLAVPNIPGSPTSYKNIQVQIVEFQDSLAYNQLAKVSITGAALLSEQTHAIVLTVTDAGGLSATCPTTLTVVDTTPPAIASCAPPQSASADALNCRASVPDFTGGVVATDCNGPLVITQSPAAGTLVGPGTTAVTLTVKDAANNTATCATTFTVQPVVDLSVQVVSAPGPVTVGQPVSYTVTVSNLGACPASGVIVNNVLPAGQVLVSVTDPGTSVARACPTPGPSVWYRAEGNADDSVGVNHGTVSGGVSFGPQAVAQGFIFDGLTGYISVPDAPALRPASLTIEGWIDIHDPNGLHVLLAKPQGGGLADSYSVWIASGVLNAAISDGTGSGPFLTYPNFPTSSLFLFSDITNLPSLANKLKNPAPADFVSQHLNSQLSAETLALLAAYAGGPDTLLQRHIVADFNRIIQSGPLHKPARFAGVTLSDETLYVLGRNPTGIDLARLNRLLIRDTYPAEIVMNLFPQLNQRYHIAYTFDPATQKQALYVDGELVDSSFVTKTITYADRPLVLGAGENSGGTADYFYQGEMDELAIFNRALSGIEVQGIHGAGANGKCFNTGAVVLGGLAGGASRTFTVVAVPTTCPTASLQSTVSGAETDPILANNTAITTATVAELDPSQLRLSIRRVSPNNNNVQISWPITCAPFILESTDDLSPYPSILWTPTTLPTLILQGRYSTVIPASEAQHFFRLKGQ